MLVVLLPAVVALSDDTPYQGQLNRSQIIMRCERGGGIKGASSFRNGEWMTLEISCDGRFAMLFADSLNHRSSVSPDSALALANDLVERDFFGLQPMFRNEYGELRPVAGDEVEVSRSYRDFGMEERITLQLGPHSHTVELRDPARAAPGWLRQWLHRFYAVAQTGLSTLGSAR